MGVLKRVLDTVAGWAQSLEERCTGNEAVLLDVKRSVQADGYSCGTQSAFMVLRYYGRARSIEAVTHQLGTDEDGTNSIAIIRLLRKRRLVPVVKRRASIRDLRRALRGGSPVIVSLDDGGHWAVVYGCAPDKIFLADPSLARGIRVGIPVARFRQRWNDRWAIVVHKKR